MEALPYSHISKGTFLIASPDLDTGIYFRSVLVICEHSPGGSFALMINKSLEIELPEDILNIKQLINPHVQIRAGGPIQPNQMMLLHSSDQIPDQTLKVCEGVHLGGDLQFLQEAISDANGPSIRLCFGYCGWGAGQLEREFLNGGWFLHPASAKYIFEIPPEKIWQSILREMGGKYATMSMIPEDLSLN
jgi:putative transcriptional regulator